MNLNQAIRKRKRTISRLLLGTILLPLLPSESVALTSGPSQPEFQEFEQASTTEMVDPFTGDFTYNIPLFELPGPNGGYPMNLAYHAGVTPDQEASWIGLGWAINAGAITRRVRGLPDDFRGDEVTTTQKMTPNITLGVGAGVGVEFFGGDALKGSLGLTGMYNNYTGISYALDGSLGFPVATGSKVNAGLGLDFSLNTDGGLTLRPSLNASALTLSGNTAFNTKGSIGLGYHSRSGLSDLSFGLSLQTFHRDGETKTWTQNPLKRSFSAPLSLANQGFTPVIHTPMVNTSVNFVVRGGGSWWGAFPNAYLKGFYNKQKFRDESFTIKGYGYKHLQDAGTDDLLDFNRERDGLLYEESPNLPVPVLMHDVYKIQGQGIGSMFRPLRNDMGVVHDNARTSESTSGSLGADIGPLSAHLGVNLGLSLADNRSEKWNFNGSAVTRGFESFKSNDIHEPWHYQVRGEHASMETADFKARGGDQAIEMRLSGSNTEPNVDWDVSFQGPGGREQRVKNVLELTNEMLLNGAHQSVLPLFNIQELRARPATSYPSHHVAGYITTNEEGIRYVYALPVYNLEKHEVTYGPATAKSSDRFLANLDQNPATRKHYQKITTGKYAHSYLLTSVVGPDYVDVTGDGVTADDLGYWVKFNYQAQGQDYYWKTPYEDAFFSEGNRFETADDRGNLQYGRKELWYLSSAETKTHVARYYTADRSDDQGARDFHLGIQSTTVPQRLTKITLFPRVPGTEEVRDPLVSVHFDNTGYTLCPGTPNASAGGKLTLDGLYFTYGKSEKKLNTYTFDYAFNASYEVNAQDRWGYYRSNDATPLDNKRFPYVDQKEGDAAKAARDKDAAMWCLTEITLPSGGTLEVDYEMDDYAYVQHKRAMKMVPIKNAGLTGNRLDFTPEEGRTPQEYLNALQGEDVYFRALVNNLNGSSEYISGYLTPGAADAIGFSVSDGGKHPIAKRAWQHMQTNASKLINNNPGDMDRKVTGTDFFPAIQVLSSLIREIGIIFKGFDGYAEGKEWANTLNVQDAWVRLPVLNGYKYGGGHRVRRILIREDASDAQSGVYGQLYDYTIEEGGRTISSGVAANEPMVGGEENPLRKAKPFTQSIPLHSDNRLFFEYPVNEGSFPGPGVGYRKVTVMSLAAAEKSNHPLVRTLSQHFYPDAVDYGTTGKMEYEFYTAKEFPTMTDETFKRDKGKKSWKPLPLVGVDTEKYYAATQGYSIVNNDMHGKLRRTSRYRQQPGVTTAAGVGGASFESAPYAYTEYSYRTREVAYEGEAVHELNNYFRRSEPHLLRSAAFGTGDRMLGVEQEVVLDARKHTDEAFQGGADFNLDLLNFILVVVPIPTVWPNISRSFTESKTVVSNKITFKSGILESMETFSEGAKVTTRYLAWDELTGRPVLTVTEDQFENEPVYSRSVPAHTQYLRMGPAYRNLGFRFNLINPHKFSGKDEYEAYIGVGLLSGADPLLVPGDECILSRVSSSEQGTPVPEAFAVYLGTYSGSPRFYSKAALDADAKYQARVIRSGKRNHLSTDAGTVTALADPTKVAGTTQQTTTVVVPTN
ncbi:MAG: hypothetical protein AAGA66_00905 [Bacteroidota bacterium]